MFRWWPFWVVGLMILSACDGRGPSRPETPQFQGGIGVGNGMQSDAKLLSYVSPFGFSFSYASKLTLKKEANEKQIIVDNSGLESRPDQQSRMEVNVLSRKGDSWENFRKLVEADHPDLAFEIVDFPGARALVWVKHEGNHLQSLYYFLTDGKDIVQTRLTASLPGNGLTWVAPIVKTMRFDVKPPVVHEIIFETPEVKVGEPAVVAIRATDDLSGIDIGKTVLRLCFDPDPKVADISSEGQTWEIASDRGADWFRIRIPVGKWKPSGKFRLADLNLKDRTGNESVNYPEPATGLSVINSGVADTTAPDIHRVVIGKGNAVTLAGKMVTKEIWVVVTDDQSGLDLSQACYEFLSLSDHRVYRISDCRPLVEIEPGAYRVTFDLQKSLVTGQYILSLLRIRDRAGNSTELTGYGGVFGGNYRLVTAQKEIKQSKHRPIGIILTNPAESDSLGPEILEFAPLPPMKAGTKGELRFRTKDPSGIFLRIDHQRLTGQDRGRWLREANPRSPHSIVFAPDIRKIEGTEDWYAAAFEIPPYLIPGRYFLSEFMVVDQELNEMHLSTQAWNENRLSQKRFDLWDGSENAGKDEGGIEIPFLNVLPSDAD